MSAPQEGFIARVVGVFVKSKVTPLIVRCIDYVK